MDFDTEIRVQGKPIHLGVLGTHQQLQKEDLYEKVLHPVISALGRLPESILVSSEGTSSVLISLWAEQMHVEVQSVEADWKRYQRRAGILRDSRIQKQATCLLVFQGPRSKAYEQMGIREAKKGKQVFLVDHATLDLTELVVE
jgi:hypothetical protein